MNIASPTNCLENLNFYEFEYYIRQLLVKVGYDFIDCIRRDESAGEVDLACLTRKHFFMGQTFFWCRKYPSSKVVDADTMEALCEEMKKDKYKDCVPVKGIIITTSKFTRPAYDNYEYKNPVEYVDGNELKDLFDKYGIEVKPFGSDLPGYGQPSKYEKDKDALNILIADYSEGLHESLKMILANEKCNIASAYDGISAAGFIERYNFDLVFLKDKLLNINGYQLIEMIKKKSPKTEVIMVGVMPSEGSREKAIQLGAMEFLRCPYTIDDIHRIVNKVRGERG